VAVCVNNASVVEAKGQPNWEVLVAVREGSNTLRAFAEDMLNGTVNATVTITFKRINVDRIAPKVNITKPLDGESVVDDRLHVEGIASDNVALEGVYAKLDDGEFHRCKGLERWSIDLDVPEDGKHMVTVKAVDLTGNLVHETVSVDFKGPETTRDLPFGGPVLMMPALLLAAFVIALMRTRG